MAISKQVVNEASIRISPEVRQADIRSFAKDFQTRMIKAVEEAAKGKSPKSVLGDPDKMGDEDGKEYGDKFSDSTKKETKDLPDAISDPITKQGKGAGKEFGKLFGAAILAMGLGQVIGAGISTAIGLESNSAKMTASLGLSPEDAKKAGKIAGDLYSGAYGDSMEQVNGSVEAVIGTLGDLGVTSDEAIFTASKNALNLSSAFGIDVAESVQLVNQLITGGLAKDSDEAFDLLTKGMQKVPVALRGDLKDAIGEYGPFFKSLGLSGEDAFDILINASGKGAIGIDKTGDALKELTIRSVDGSKSSIAAYEAAGLNADKMTDKFAKGGETGREAMFELIDGIQAIEDPAEQMAAAVGLLGTPLEDLSLTELGDFLAELEGGNRTVRDFAGSAAEVDKVLGDTTESTLTGLKRGFEQTLGEVMVPLLEAALPLVQDFAAFLKDNKVIIEKLAGPLLIVGTVLTGIVAGMAAWNIVSAFFAPIMATTTAATWGFNAALLANPIVLIIVAIIALIAIIFLLGGSWETVGNVFKAIGIAIWTVIVVLANGVLMVVNGMIMAILGGVAIVAEAIKAVTGGAIDFTFSVPQIPLIPLPQMANGGVVKARKGGTAAILGEAGRNEAVVDEGLLNARMKDLEKVGNNIDNTKTGSVYNIDATNMDPYELQTVLTSRDNLYSGV